jgi:hypothetical protein
MARSSKTITITRPDAEERAEGRAPGEGGEKRPRNLPAVNIAVEGFSLMVDGKAKSHYDNAAAATEAGLALKRAFPMLQIVVYDAAEKTRTRIDLPGSTPPAAAPQSSQDED